MYSEQQLLNTLIEATVKNRLQWTTDITNAEQAIEDMRDKDIVVTFYYEKMQSTFALFYNEETALVRLVLFDLNGEWLYEMDSEDEQDGALIATLFDVASRQMSGVAAIVQSVIHDFS